MQRQKRNRIYRLTGTITLVVVIALVVVGWIFYMRAQAPVRQARSEAVALAKKKTALVHPQDFYWFNRKATYYTVAGTDKKGRHMYVIISPKGQILVTNAKDGISASRAQAIVKKDRQARAIKHVALGVYDKKIAWEVTYTNKNGRLAYDLLTFKNGSLIKSIQNI